MDFAAVVASSYDLNAFAKAFLHLDKIKILEEKREYLSDLGPGSSIDHIGRYQILAGKYSSCQSQSQYTLSSYHPSKYCSSIPSSQTRTFVALSSAKAGTSSLKAMRPHRVTLCSRGNDEAAMITVWQTQLG